MTFGHLSGELSLEIGGQAISLGRVQVPVDGHVDGYQIRLIASLGRVRDVVQEVLNVTDADLGPLTSTPPWKPEVGGTVETEEQYAAMPRGSIAARELDPGWTIRVIGPRPVHVRLIEECPPRLDRMERALRAVLELAESWRYKGEFGWDDGSHAYGPGPEDEVLDGASAELVATIQEALG